MTKQLTIIFFAFIALALYNMNLDVYELERTIIHGVSIGVLVAMTLLKK